MIRVSILLPQRSSVAQFQTIWINLILQLTISFATIWIWKNFFFFIIDFKVSNVIRKYVLLYIKFSKNNWLFYVKFLSSYQIFMWMSISITKTLNQRCTFAVSLCHLEPNETLKAHTRPMRFIPFKTLNRKINFLCNVPFLPHFDFIAVFFFKNEKKR